MKEFDPAKAGPIASVTDRVRRLAIGMPVTAVHFLGDVAAFVGAEENVALVSAAGKVSQTPVHSGGILCAVSDGARIVMGGDDGKLIAVDAKGEITLLATDAKRRWVDNVALHPAGPVAGSLGRAAFARGGKGEEKYSEVPSPVGALAFAPQVPGRASAHYN